MESIENLSPDVLQKAIDIARRLEFSVKHDSRHNISVHDIEQSRALLFKLIKYLLADIHDPNIKSEVLEILEQIFDIDIKNHKKQIKEFEDQEEKIKKENKKIRMRQIIYEAYKILDPERIAGETNMENFISNLLVRGIEVAKKYDGKEYVNKISPQDIKKLNSHSKGFKKYISNEGHKGFGKGI